MRGTRYITGTLLAAALILITLLTGFAGGITGYAATSLYSNVIDDLRADSTFNVEDYPAVDDDYSLKVIQVAESADGELFIYVYQPCARVKDFRASTIRLSQTTGVNVAPRDFKLTFINASGVLYKYKVEDITLRTGVIRYYDITAIHRAFDDDVDIMTGASGGNVVNEVVFKVGQVWTATTLNGEVTYAMYETEVIEITKKYVGYCQYDDGTKVGWGITKGATDAHFVAFSTDRKIDKLLSVDVGFEEQDVKCKVCTNVTHLWHDQGKGYDYEYSDERMHYPYPLTIYHSDKGSGGGYVWNRIRSTTDFLKDEINKNCVLTSEGATSIAGTQWVLNFYETDIRAKVDGVWTALITAWALPFVGDADVKFTKISNVTILRLSFETDGKYYNLGVVDNKQTGSGKPINVPVNKKVAGLPVWAWIVIAAVAAVAAIAAAVLICVFVPGALPVIGKALLAVLRAVAVALKWLCIGLAYLLYYLLYGIWWIISTPVKLIANAVKARKDKPKQAKPAGTGRTGNRRSERKTKPKKPKARKPHVKTKKTKAGKRK